jgi:hypothetical protein
MKILHILVFFVLFVLSGCGFVEEDTFLFGGSGTASTASDFFDASWGFRKPVDVDNTGNPEQLTDYVVKLSIDASQSDFWNEIESDGRSVRFADSDKAALLNFWTEKFDYSGQSAAFWIKVPLILASSRKNLYLYYGNPGSANASTGSNVFLFFDDFADDDVSDWTIYSSGGVQSSLDPDPPTGTASVYSIEKINNSDPHGGYKLIAVALNTAAQGYTFEGRVYRPSPYGGGAADRFAIENSSFSGYGIIVNHSSNTVGIEERSSGSGSSLGASVPLNPDENNWYKFRFDMKTGGTFDFYHLDIDDNVLASALNRSDATVSSFDRVTIHGGYEFFMDDLRIRKYTDPEPILTPGAQESQ